MNEKNVKKPGKVSLVLICILLALALIFNIACLVMRSTLDQFMGSKPTLSGELKTTGDELAMNIEREGMVLLRNENNTLPLNKDIKKVNVFGWSATQWINGGSGSGQCATFETDLLAALKAYGIEYNEELIAMYQDFQGERPYRSNGALNSWPEQFSRLYEPSISDNTFYTQTLLDHADAFSETALVVLGRIAGESNDCPTEQYKQVQKGGEIVVDDTRTYLDLSIDGIDAALLVGGTGEKAAAAIPEVLYGDVNPSGRLTDTYAYDFATNPSFATMGKQGVGAYLNGEGLYPFDGTTNGNLGEQNYQYQQVSFMDYLENIYVGYKWYETADAEGYWDAVSNEFGTGYEAAVQYPFGYGLSYTSFDWEVVNATSGELDKDGQVAVTVKVTNTGALAGKDVVELYFAAPYTVGEIEKSVKVLGTTPRPSSFSPGRATS